MNTYEKELEFAKNMAREAGEIMLKYFDANQKTEFKEDNSPVTIADKMINSLVIEKLTIAFPEDGVIGEEESNTEYGMGRKWFCDPIDGTNAYVLGLPTAMFSLALIVDGKPVVGIAYSPFLNKMYSGVKGEKSLCNDEIISVSDLDLRQGVVGISGSKVKAFIGHDYFNKMMADKVNFSCITGTVFKVCLVACGKLAACAGFGVSPHDVAAVQVILEGSGGIMTTPDGTELDYSNHFSGALISNKASRDQLIKYCS